MRSPAKGRPAWSPSRVSIDAASPRWWYLGWALVAGLFLVLVRLAALAARGTDQYWYVADVITYSAIGRAVSNTVYPTAALDSAGGDLPARIHGVPTTWVVQLVGGVIGSPYGAWVVTNAATALLVSVLLLRVARRVGGGRSAALAPMAFLAFPLTTWFTVNALVEMTLALAAALSLLGLQSLAQGRRTSGWLVLAGSALLMFYTRDNFILVVVAVLVLNVWLLRQRFGALLAGGAVLLVIAAAAAGTLFPAHPSAGLASLLSSDSDARMMGAYYGTGQPDVELGQLLGKWARGLVGSVVPDVSSNPVELLTETPVLLALAYAAYRLRGDGDTRFLRLGTAVLVGVYVATCVIFQPQNRYIFVLVPSACLAVAHLHAMSRPRRATAWALSGILVLLAGAGVLAAAYRSGAITERQQVLLLQAAFAQGPEGPVLAIGEDANLLLVGYAAAPRSVLTLDAVLNSPSEAREVVDRWGVRSVLCSSDAECQFVRQALRTGPAVDPLRPLRSISAPGVELQLFALD